MNVELSRAVDQLQAMVNNVIGALPSILVGFVALILFFAVSGQVRRITIGIWARAGRRASLGRVLGRLAQWGIMLLGILVSAAIVFPNFSPADIISILGVGSVAIGFAFRDILQNFLAGILLLLNEPFRIGDQIVVGDFEGTVEDIETRATTIRTYDGRRVVIPNGDLFVDSVMVNTAFEHRRIEYDVLVGNDSDIAMTKRLILDAIGSTNGILREPAPDALVIDLNQFGILIRVRWWISPPVRFEALDSRDQVLTKIKATLDAHHIDLPYPTYTLVQAEEEDEG